MKKGLSVLLIAAALFGFYGGATNLNDVLACKDYFTSASGASDDMQRLEDGLNQLKDNEQAYLDGQVALAEGEKTLADGYAALADGERQYAEGLAAYKAAPGQLAEGRDGLKQLRKAIQGINDLKAADGYPKWKKNYESMRDARKLFYDGTKDLADSLTQLATFLDSGQKAYLAAVKDVAKDDGKQTYKDYNTYIKSTNELAKDIPKIQKNVKDRYEGASALYSALKATKDNKSFAALVGAKKEALLSMAKLIEIANGKKAAETYKQTIEKVAENADFDAVVDAKLKEFLASDKGKQTEAYLISQNMDAGWDQFFASDKGKAGIQQLMAGYGMTEEEAKAYIKENNAEAKAGVEAAVKEKVDAGIKDNPDPENPGVKQQVDAAYEDPEGDLTKAKVGLTQQYQKSGDGGVIGIVVASLGQINDMLNAKDSKLNTDLLPGLKQFNDATKKKEGKNGAKQLLEAQDDSIADGVEQLVSGILGDKVMKKALIKKVGRAKVNSMRKYGTSNSPLYSKNSDFAQFNKKMSKDPDVMSFLKAALPIVKARLAAGEKEYAAGLKSYKDAPAKLADARQQLADGRAQLADGEKQLEDGKAQLAQYEDGEQQVRDGLATLVGTDAMGNVQSIADRIGNDTDFDNGDTHLELDEGLSAVQAGKGYAADLTAAVTDEIMGRAVGTGLLIGAGVLAVLAALLSFLKKNKGAGVFALLAAAAGCVGAVMGNNAGTQFSSIAGSTMGATPWIAAGILAAVAAVHAIVHFAAKKAA